MNKSFKQKQLDIINKYNPAHDNYHTWIRSTKDILTPKQAGIKTKNVMVYSSKPLKQGNFVTTYKQEAMDYAGGGKIYSRNMLSKNIAWIDESQGQIARVKNIKRNIKKII